MCFFDLPCNEIQSLKCWKQSTLGQKNEEESLAQTFPSRLFSLISSWNKEREQHVLFQAVRFLWRSLIVFHQSQRKVEMFGVQEEFFGVSFFFLSCFPSNYIHGVSSSCPSALLLSSCPLSHHINRSCAAHSLLHPSGFSGAVFWSVISVFYGLVKLRQLKRLGQHQPLVWDGTQTAVFTEPDQSLPTRVSSKTHIVILLLSLWWEAILQTDIKTGSFSDEDGLSSPPVNRPDSQTGVKHTFTRLTEAPTAALHLCLLSTHTLSCLRFLAWLPRGKKGNIPLPTSHNPLLPACVPSQTLLKQIQTERSSCPLHVWTLTQQDRAEIRSVFRIIGTVWLFSQNQPCLFTYYVVLNGGLRCPLQKTHLSSCLTLVSAVAALSRSTWTTWRRRTSAWSSGSTSWRRRSSRSLRRAAMTCTGGWVNSG